MYEAAKGTVINYLLQCIADMPPEDRTLATTLECRKAYSFPDLLKAVSNDESKGIGFVTLLAKSAGENNQSLEDFLGIKPAVIDVQARDNL